MGSGAPEDISGGNEEHEKLSSALSLLCAPTSDQSTRLWGGQNMQSNALPLLFGKPLSYPVLLLAPVEQCIQMVLEQNERLLETHNLIPWAKERKK